MHEPTSAELLNSLTVSPPAFSAADAERIARQQFDMTGVATELGGERDRNFSLRCSDAKRLLKVTNRAEPEALVDLQCKALRHIEKCDPSLPVPRLIASRAGNDWVEARGSDSYGYHVRLFTYLPGELLGEVPDDPRLMRGLGALVAKLGRALRGFHHTSADHALAWDLKRADRLAYLSAEMPRGERQSRVEAIFEDFQTRAKPVLAGLRAQVIHNDVSFHNAVVDPREPWRITGVYDFGDLIHAPLIQDLAVTASEVAAGRSDPLAASAEIIAGYHEVTPLESEELAVLPTLVATRLAMSFAIGAWKPHADERDHYHSFDGNIWEMMRAMEARGHASLEHLYRAACGIAPVHGARERRPASTEDLRKRRVIRLGRGYELSFERPLHTVRGEGVWLYDADGNAYLDAYNNVPQVGHCHPRVVAALSRQAATLNTNTRYLYESIVAFGDRLTATLPEELEICMLVSSGSEANDLAWRIAKTCTGHTGGLVVENAYHGVTDATYDLSPYDLKGPDELAPHVQTVKAPDDYRGPWGRAISDRGMRYAQDAEAALARLEAKGHAPAAFFVDTVLSSAGIFEIPPGYLAGIFQRVRAAGGLCVADEVQAGFGRTGKHMWGFQLDAVVPDIVTFGKPIGNGHPIGAVVTRRDIAEQFSSATGFFSTTGGNPVSCAAGIAVLEVIERESLQENATEVGHKLRSGIADLASRHTLIGDVRGPGLFIGVELVRDRSTLEPAAEETRAVVNGMRERGVLIGRDGPHHNVLKIRPPIVFGPSHVTRFVETLDEVLSAIE